MKDLTLIQHCSGAVGLRFFGLGPRFRPCRGIKKLKALFKENTLWAQKRHIKEIKQMLSSSDVVVSVWENTKLIGFGRATTDKIYRAVLWDIVVDNKYQRMGIGKQIVNSLLSNKFLLKVEKVYIMTTSCEGFYSKMNFKLEKNQKLMFLEKGKVYE